MAGGPAMAASDNDAPSFPASVGQGWPSQAAAYYALFVIILATGLNFFDAAIFGMMAQRIKIDFGLTDEQLGFLGGPASVIFYVVVGIPLARLADIYPRQLVLSGGMAATGVITALGGLAQNFVQFIGSRMFVGAGGSAHAPSAYSMLSDYFPPNRITRAFALLQLGFIGGGTLGVMLGGAWVVKAAATEPTQLWGLTIRGWQWILIYLGLLGLVAALLFLTVKEPPRRRIPTDEPVIPEAQSLGRRILTFTGWDAMRAIHGRGRFYYPLFGALALSAIETFGLAFWRTPFMIRTYGWDEAKIGAIMGPMLLVSQLAGIFLGGIFVEWMAKRYKDANVRSAAILFSCVTVCSIVAPLMPTGEAALAVMSLAGVFGLAGAVPQNAAIQRIAPNEIRGQVTAIYLFMFTFFGAMGSFVIGVVAQRIVGVEEDLWKALVITAATLLPLATFLMYRGIKPYREEVERLEALEQQAVQA